MSNWGRNYSINRNQNYYQNHNSYHNYSHRNRSYENWANYDVPHDNTAVGVNQSLLHNSVPYIPNGDILCREETAVTGSDLHYQFDASRDQLPHCNLELDSETLTLATNSRLTATAGEFIPRSTYHSSSNLQLQEPPNLSMLAHTQRSQSGSTLKHNETSTRSKETSVIKNGKEETNQQRRNFSKVKNRNVDHRRQLNVEQSKEEGRRKLLQEAAGLASKENIPGPSRELSTNSVESSRRRPQKPVDKLLKYNGESKVFSRSNKSSDSYRNQPYYSSSGKTPPGSNTRRDRLSDTNKGVGDTVSQRDRLTDQLNRGVLECLVCCDVIKQTDHTWSCHNCYHVLHLRCILKWATSSKAENGWRCPACQNVSMTTPRNYYCFCGKMVNPEWNRSDTAHSCGELCNKLKVLTSEFYSCVHHCTLLCHPGPCPPCMALVTRKCGCSGSSQTVQCGQTQPLLCGSTCNKPLLCGFHKCPQKCHFGKCEPCQVLIKQTCYCGRDSQEVTCDGQNLEGDKFSCGKQCDGKLTCNNHPCRKKCHEGPCGMCPRDPAHVTHCHCGKTELSKEQHRTSCLDPIPTCNQICGKQLLCGQPSNPHQCKALCHEGPCPPCDQMTLVRCRCGYMDREVPCTELTTKADDARCQKKCTKKRTCGKHKCNQLCCIDVDHVCPLPCNHMLSCGQHRCDQLCHRGHCQPCLQSSFEELYCECGTNVLLPPIACGTKPPPCNQPCTRTHECDHEVLHSCHSFPTCPPCGVLTSKYCHGKHELRKAVPCHMKEFSCGRPCGRELPCNRHKCVQLCHKGDCATNCRQPCTKPRSLCGHPCNAPCHDGECVDSPCKENVIVSCECGHRTMSRPCFENNNEYQRIAISLLASKMADVQLGRAVNLDDMQGPRNIKIKTLECSEECRVVERNRRLAIGLQIRNPDLSAKLTPRYSDFMRAWAKKDQRFCQYVHDKLTELVKLAKESKQKSRSYSFETMNREKRQFVHEYCTHFGCESVAYDAEPKRNVVATALRDKAWLPSYSLLEVVQREMGQRKVPLPNLNSTVQKPIPQSNVLPLKVTPAKTGQPSTADSLQIDYFDYKG